MSDPVSILVEMALRAIDIGMRREDVLGIIQDKKAMGATDQQISKLLSDMADDAISDAQAKLGGS